MLWSPYQRTYDTSNCHSARTQYALLIFFCKWARSKTVLCVAIPSVSIPFFHFPLVFEARVECDDDDDSIRLIPLLQTAKVRMKSITRFLDRHRRHLSVYNAASISIYFGDRARNGHNQLTEHSIFARCTQISLTRRNSSRWYLLGEMIVKAFPASHSGGHNHVFSSHIIILNASYEILGQWILCRPPHNKMFILAIFRICGWSNFIFLYFENEGSRSNTWSVRNCLEWNSLLMTMDSLKAPSTPLQFDSAGEWLT